MPVGPLGLPPRACLGKQRAAEAAAAAERITLSSEDMRVVDAALRALHYATCIGFQLLWNGSGH